ncbi:MAG: biotin-dependent carboxyltransferase family protein [Vicinamibacterales bacterium]
MTASGYLHVVKGGLLTTVQDLGRWHHQAEGVPVSGPMDAYSHRLANHLVGNAPDAATLEVTLMGPELVVEADTVVVVTGADFDLTCNGEPHAVGTTFAVRAGQVLRFGRRRQGARAYLAIAGGGVLTPPVLGSRATHWSAAWAASAAVPWRRGSRADRSGGRLSAAPCAGADPADVRPRTAARPAGAPGRVVHRRGVADLHERELPYLDPPDRMGYRLEGPPLARTDDRELISEPVAVGAIQCLPPASPSSCFGRQTAGGYPKIGYVISADLCLAGQLAPGDFIEFERCTHAEAVAALIARERQLMGQMTPPRGVATT